jgi:predicted HicB family RNase H-like nuclease
MKQQIKGGDRMATVHKSVRVDKELWQQARAKALAEGKTMQDLIADLLKKYLERGK